MPDTIESAVQSLQEPATVVAGCTDHFPGLKGAPPGRIVDVSGIDAMIGIKCGASGWWIGAATPWTDIIHHPLPAAFDCLKAAAREVGSIQIQNAGTVAGNICNASPAADGVPPLLALDAMVEVTSSRGAASMPLADFIRGPRQITLGDDELVTAVHGPPVPERAASTFLKLGARKYLVISIAMIAVICVVDAQEVLSEIRVAVGSCSPVASRLRALEADLVNRPARDLLTEVPISPASLAPLTPIDDVRAPASYRLHAAEELCRRAIQSSLAEALEVDA